LAEASFNRCCFILRDASLLFQLESRLKLLETEAEIKSAALLSGQARAEEKAQALENKITGVEAQLDNIVSLIEKRLVNKPK
jgi:hypothetical protein